MGPTDDRRLLELTATGDELSFADLYDRHAETVARYLWAWLPSADDVQELVQETFVTAWQKAADVHVVGASALPWLLVVAKNHARNRSRKVARRRETGLEAWSDRLSDEASAEDRDRLRWIHDEMADLSDTDRRICELCLVEGASYKEAAAELGHSVTVVAKILQRAKARIRKGVLSHD